MLKTCAFEQLVSFDAVRCTQRWYSGCIERTHCSSREARQKGSTSPARSASSG